MGILYAVDAPMILKWVLPPDEEPWEDAAYEMFRSYRHRGINVTVPALRWCEVGNILSRKYPEKDGR